MKNGTWATRLDEVLATMQWNAKSAIRPRHPDLPGLVLISRLVESILRTLVLGIFRLTVDDFVTVGASTFNMDQRYSTSSVQQVQYHSVENYQFQ